MRRRGIDFLPETLKEAVDALAEDDVVKAGLGEEYADYFVEVKRNEWMDYHLHVAEWERDRYLPIV